MRREAMRKVGSEEKAERIMDRADCEVKKIEVIAVGLMAVGTPHFGSRFSRVRPELNRFKTNKEYIEPRTGSAVRSR
jgi:hypothetical protein